MSVESIIAKTSEYLSIPAVVGYEGYFMAYLQKDFEALGFEAFCRDGVLAVRGGNPGGAIASAHIDRHGLISIGGGEYAYAAQYVKEIKYGQNNRASQAELESISRRFEGEEVYAYDAATADKIGNGTIRRCESCMGKGDAVFLVPDMAAADLGTPIAYARTASQCGEYLKGQIDNAISLGVLYTLCANGFDGTVLLTTEEEIGKSGLHIARWLAEEQIETKRLLILDTSPYKTNEIIDAGKIVLRNRDKTEEFNRGMVAQLKERCAALGIPYDVKDEMLLAQGKETRQLGSTELGRLVAESHGRWNGATVQIPTVEYHTSNETTSRLCIKNYYELLADILIQDKMSV